MEENENKKNARAFYLTLAVIMAVVVLLIISTTIARRNLPGTDSGIDTSSGLTDDTQTGTDVENSDTLPQFSMPVNGVIEVDFSDTVPVFSQTMNDYRTHTGIDIMASLGTEVVAVADGVVTNVWDDPFMGTCISIEHTGNAISVYKNLDPEVKDGIIIGASVKGGDVIGAVGESAMNELAEEPHLHYELKINGKHVDPKEHLTPPTNEENAESNQENQ